MANIIIEQLDSILKELAPYEKGGLDTSSLKIFIKNLKEFSSLNQDIVASNQTFTIDDKLRIIKEFLEDKKAFPKIDNVIDFANSRLELDFVNQKASRDITIARIISRIKNKPELKDKLKDAVLSIRNEMVHTSRSSRSKKTTISADTFSKWADIIQNI